MIIGAGCVGKRIQSEGIMAFSADSTLSILLADPRAKEVLIRHFAERVSDPRVDQVLHETLRSISYYPEAGISREKLDAVDADLKAL